jgi:ABC-type iron transport system FetAB permease component
MLPSTRREHNWFGMLLRLDMPQSPGLVRIPGVMAGMMASGASPIYAGISQFILAVPILTASGVAGMVVTLMLCTNAVSPLAQRILPTNMRLHGSARYYSVSQTRSPPP